MKRNSWAIPSSGLPCSTDEQKDTEFAALLVHLHWRIYGSWMSGTQVRAVLDALPARKDVS